MRISRVAKWEELLKGKIPQAPLLNHHNSRTAVRKDLTLDKVKVA